LGLSSQIKIPINNEKLRQTILTSLADPEMVNIINSAVIQSKSITEIIKETGIAHTSAYRKTNWMLENGLVIVEKIKVTKDGKKFSLLKSVFKSINVRYEHEKVTVEVERNVDTLQRTAERIFSLNS
jgi:hypothetical protein